MRYLTIALLLVVGFASCSKDDDDNPTPNSAPTGYYGVLANTRDITILNGDTVYDTTYAVTLTYANIKNDTIFGLATNMQGTTNALDIVCVPEFWYEMSPGVVTYHFSSSPYYVQRVQANSTDTLVSKFMYTELINPLIPHLTNLSCLQ